MTITYREAKPNDAIQIAHLHALSWQRHYGGSFDQHYLDNEVVSERETVWSQRFSNPNPDQYACLAERDHDLCGFVCAYFNDDPNWGTLLDNLHVLDEYMRMGIGMQLMAKTAKWVEERSTTQKMYLWVLANNVNSIKFYERIGGLRTEEIIKDIPGGGKARLYRYVWNDLNILISKGRKSR